MASQPFKVNAKVKGNTEVAIRKSLKVIVNICFSEAWRQKELIETESECESGNVKSLKVRMNIFQSLRLRGKKK